MFSLHDRKLAQEIVFKIKKLDVKLKFMHVCGTHQDTLVRNGLDYLFRECGVNIVQGPGCPVCVTTPMEIEEIMLLAEHGKIIATFGDMINVPGEKYSLRDMRENGYAIHTVYGIEDAVFLAEKYRSRDVVFMGIGFETTAPTTAAVLLKKLPSNFSILSCHRVIPPALKTILDMGEIRIDGLIEPGHVSTIIGLKPYEFISREYNIPQVVAGFEPLDLIMAVWLLVRQIENRDALVENEYTRAVKKDGNIRAQEIMKEVFEPVDKRWRGFPVIPKSGLELKKEFDEYNARKKYDEELQEVWDKEFKEPRGCRCGELLRGLLSPQDCPLFGRKCTPDTPVGPCMVSIEGSCNIEFRYKKKTTV